MGLHAGVLSPRGDASGPVEWESTPEKGHQRSGGWVDGLWPAAHAGALQDSLPWGHR